jgi:DNA-binding transcriptional LysR family regulator
MAVAPPRPKGFALNALRAVEAAGRLGSFAAAARELGVTPGAITAHVKALEAELDAPIFKRTAREVALTPLGHRVLPDLTQAFDAVGSASQTLRREAAPKTVHIATLPALAQLWLSPRLPELRKTDPDITISITALEVPPNLKRAPFDLCVFYGTGRQGDGIAQDALYPVCAPSVAETLRVPEDLAHIPCLSDAVWADDWARWLAIAAPHANIVPRGPVFSLYALAVEEAINGAGVLMGHDTLVARLIDEGRLVRPFPQRAPTPETLRIWSDAPLRMGSAADRVRRHLLRLG